MNVMEMHRSILIWLLTIDIARILDWRGPNHKSIAIASSGIFKRENLGEKKISLIFFLCNKEDQKLWLGVPKVKK